MTSAYLSPVVSQIGDILSIIRAKLEFKSRLIFRILQYLTVLGDPFATVKRISLKIIFSGIKKLSRRIGEQTNRRMSNTCVRAIIQKATLVSFIYNP